MDLSWFITIPGMLITGGVLLLIIALIIFILTSGKKNKKEKTPKAQEGDLSNLELPQIPNQAVDGGVTPDMVAPSPEQPSIPVTSDSNMTIPTTVNPSSMNQAVEAAPTMTDTTNLTQEPQMPASAAQPGMAPVMDTPIAQPEMAPVMDTPATQPAVAPVADIPVAQPEVSIYGGANPAVNVNVNNESHQIYGGADPLENTQMISTNDIQTAATQPEVAPVVDATAVQPAVAPVVDTPVAQPEVVMPQVTPVVDNQQNI